MTDTPSVLLDGLVFPEGPRWHEDRLWFSDMHANEVVAVDEAGNRETIVVVPNKPSGLGWLPTGDLLIVSMADRRLLRLSGGELHEHADMSGLTEHFCNDMVVDAQGRAYVGNFGYDLYGGGEYATTNLILVTPDGVARTAAEDLAFPNGTVITPDGRTLIVGETRARCLTAFDIAGDGSLSNRRLWADIGAPPDGIALDAENCVWVGVPNPGSALRVAEGGEIRQRIDVPDMGVFACMLGGADGRTLFLLEAASSQPAAIQGRGNGRIRAVRVDAPRAGWP